MTLRISATDDMEAALVSLHARHHRVVVYRGYKCIKPIRFRYALTPPDLPVTVTWEWRHDKDMALARFAQQGGILDWRPTPRANEPTMPECDALLIAEAPLRWQTWEHIIKSVRQEVVVYRPPTWDLHEETVDALWPRAYQYETLRAYIEALRDMPTTAGQKSLAYFSGFDHFVAFTYPEIAAITWWKLAQMRAMFRPLRYMIHRYEPYTVRLTPDDPDLQWAYAMLKQQYSIGPRTYCTRFDWAIGRPEGFKSMLKLLVKKKYVTDGEPIYVVNVDNVRVDPEKQEAINNVHRSRWLKVKRMVDDLPEYGRC